MSEGQYMPNSSFTLLLSPKIVLDLNRVYDRKVRRSGNCNVRDGVG